MNLERNQKSKGIKTDESRKKLLKFMLDQVRKLRDEADNKGPRPHKGRSHKSHRGTHKINMVEATIVRSQNDDRHDFEIIEHDTRHDDGRVRHTFSSSNFHVKFLPFIQTHVSSLDLSLSSR